LEEGIQSLIGPIYSLRKLDKQMSMDVGMDYESWNSKKMWKRKVLEEPVPLH